VLIDEGETDDAGDANVREQFEVLLNGLKLDELVDNLGVHFDVQLELTDGVVEEHVQLKDDTELGNCWIETTEDSNVEFDVHLDAINSDETTGGLAK
jgi:hypothetical protein